MPTEHSSPEAPFPDHWVDGLDPNEPALQVHRHAEGTWIMRQSLLDHWEGPFIYLFAGEERAILFDTGAPGKFPLRETVDDLVGKDFPLSSPTPILISTILQETGCSRVGRTPR